MSQKVEMRGVCMFQGQIAKFAPKSPGKSGIFLVLTLFFLMSLPKIWLTHTKKITFLELARIGLSFHKAGHFSLIIVISGNI